jgi:hypothetical protein
MKRSAPRIRPTLDFTRLKPANRFRSSFREPESGYGSTGEVTPVEGYAMPLMETSEAAAEVHDSDLLAPEVHAG